LCISPGKGKPIIDPFERIKARKARVPCEKFVFILAEYPFKVAKNLLEDIEEVKLYAPVLDSMKGLFNGVEVCVVKPYFSAPPSVAALELLIAAGAKKFIVVGEAGAIHPLLRIGDVLIPTWGVREEGTSYHYMPPDYTPKPSFKLVHVLEEEVRRIKGRRRIKILRGGIWTTDAIFRETKNKVEEYSKMGVLGVEMEATALMTVAEYRKVDLAVVLSISDELYGKEWRPGFKTRKLKRTERIIVKAALNAITKI